jgi:uncharacterized protein (DUF697 family)/tellurite resistance protein
MNSSGPSAVSSNDALLAICLFSAFADGDQSNAERQIIAGFSEEAGNENVAVISRRILMGKLDLKTAVAALESPQDKMLAYEMARSVCEVGGVVSPDEQQFLSELREWLGLGSAEIQRVDDEIHSLALAPLDSSATTPASDHHGMILKYSILNGALELLPETLATLAIIPMQIKMVYRIGKSHGVELDRGSIKVFLASIGVGLGSQVVEGFARKLMRGVGKKMGGSMGSRVLSQATGSAFSFASTYAIGHAAQRYYAGGRNLAAPEMKALFTHLTREGRELQAKHLPQIEERAKSLNAVSVLALVRGSAV